MIREIFYDTAGFFAVFSSDDVMHELALAWNDRPRFEQVKFITTDAIISETCTLFVARRKPHLIPRFFKFLENTQALAVLHLHEDWFEMAKRFLIKHLDQGFSFTDCTSFVVMKEFKLKEVLTTDRHFQTAGFRALLLEK
jgi:hypothetical protein